MPNVTDVYYDLLLKALTKGKYAAVNLTKEAMDVAMQEVERQIQEMSPNPNDLDGSFESFAARQQQPGIYDQLRPDNNTIGPEENNESRYAYAQRCTREVMKTVEWRVRQELEWRSATDRLGLYNEDTTLKQIDRNRFLDRLMKAGGTAEDRQFNEAIVALAALANGDITEEKYLELRKKHHLAANKSQEEAADQAKHDLKNGAEFIYQAVESAIRDDSVNLNRYKYAAAAIHSGNYSDFNGGMEEAFATFRNNAVELQSNGAEIFAFLNKLGLKYPTKEKQEEKRQHWLDEAMSVAQIEEAAEQAANPYFALLDPFKLYRAFNVENGGGFLPAEQDQQPQDALAYALLRDGSAYQVTAGRALSRRGLMRCALSADDEVMEERLPGFSVFHKDDRTVILKVGRADDNGIVSAEIDASGELIRQGMPDEARALVERCAGWSTESRTSLQFEDMRKALQEVAKLKFSEKPTEEELRLAGAQFSELLWSTQAYLDHKLEQHPDERWSGSYERARVEFANSVMKFTRKKLRQLDYLDEQKKTIAMRDQAEADPEYAVNKRVGNPKYAGMSALEHKLAVEQEQRDAAEAQERERQRQEQEKARRRQEKARAEKDRASASSFGTLTQEFAAASKDSAAAKKKLEESIRLNAMFCGMSKRALDNGKTPTGAPATQANKDELLRVARRNVALYIISELVSEEQQKQQNHKGAVKAPITQIVNAKQETQLVEMIVNSDAFEQAIGDGIRYDNVMEIVKATREGNLHDVCAQVGREFLTGIALALREQEHKNREQAVGQDAPKNGEPKAEEKKENQPDKQQENQNRINIINEDNEDELEQEFKEKLKGVLSEAREVQSRGGPAGEAMKTYCTTARTDFAHVMGFMRARKDPYGFKSNAARTVLATEILRYMLTQEGAGGVLANAVEKGQLSGLQNAIQCSDAFTESFGKFDWEKKLGTDRAAENQFCKQVGDKLLRSAKPVLEEETPLVARQKASEKGTPADRRHFNDSLKDIFNINRMEKWEKEGWALKAAEDGKEHPARDYLNQQIDNEQAMYDQLGEKGGEHLQTALAGAILTEMMSDKRTHGVFEAAVEYGMYPQLIQMIRTSPLFNASIAKLDPADTEQVEKYVKKSEDYVLPLGERILQMCGDTLKTARFNVLDKERFRLYHEAFAEAEAVKEAGKQPSEKAVERARESVALSAVFGLLSHDYDTNKNLSNEQLRKIAYDSKEFKETIAKYDLHDPKQMTGACFWRPGHQFPIGFGIGGNIASRMKKERQQENEQKQKEQAQKIKKVSRKI